jgi:glycosyltransferase involved in cell wall biosynthesis
MLARGIPIVATNTYSHTQVLDDDVAFLVEPNPSSMAAGILEALNPDGNGKCKATNAQHLYEQKYSRKIYKDKIRYLLNHLDTQNHPIPELELTRTK